MREEKSMRKLLWHWLLRMLEEIPSARISHYRAFHAPCSPHDADGRVVNCIGSTSVELESQETPQILKEKQSLLDYPGKDTCSCCMCVCVDPDGQRRVPQG